VKETLISNGFIQCQSSPSTYFIRDLVDSQKMLAVSTCVDDFRAIDNQAPHLAEKLKNCLVVHYHEVTTSATKTFAGIEYTLYPNGSVLTTQDRYIRRLGDKVGIAHMPPVSNPALKDFFESSVLPADIIPVDLMVYQSLTGSLVQTLKCRDEVRHLISHLCSKNSTPTEGDYRKALHVLRYLYSTPGIGRVFKSNNTDIVIYADAAFAIHEDGTSAGAYIISIGRHSAPFVSYAKSQTDVAPCPMTAEYYSASKSLQQMEHYLQLGQELGFHQSGPVKLILDSQTAINLIKAPEVTKKARHIKAKHHYIRQANQRNVIEIEHTKTQFMRCDNITKIFSNTAFIRGRDGLLNSKANS